MRLRNVSLSILLLGLVGSAWGWERYQTTALQRRAQEAYEREDFDLAQAQWNELLRRTPEDAYVHYRLGQLARRTFDYPEAKRQLELAAKHGYDPDRLALENQLLALQLSNWRGKEGSLFERASRQDPEAARIHEVMALAFHGENLVEPGLHQVTKWLELEPNSPSAWELRGQLFERMSRYELAYESFAKALALDPTRYQSQLGAGNMAVSRSRLDVAVEHYREAVRLEHKEWEARVGYAKALAELQQFEAAKEQAAVALLLKPNSYQTLGAAGRVAMQAGDLKQAEEYFRAASSEVNDLLTLTDYRACLIRLKRADDAKKIDERIQKLDADLVRLTTIRTQLLNPNDPAPRVEAAQIFFRNGQPEQGMGWIKEALKIAPNYGPAHAALADLYDKMKRPEQAEFHRQRAGKPKS